MQQLRSAIHNAIARFLKNQPPARIIAVGFALLILLGAALLMLPFAVHPGAHVGPLDALFTATSAVCVTGLVVVDTGDTFSLFGQAVIAILIQIGGLGVASIGMGLALVAGRRISLKGRSLVREALNVESLEGMVRLVRAILLVTLICEVAGAALSFPSFARDHMPLQAVWLSIFHSIAAFNNAGFDALGGGQSLIPYQNDLLLNLVTDALVIVGGIGFMVILDVGRCRGQFRRMTFHTKVVLSTTAVLLVGGAVLLQLTDHMGWLAALFQSMTARTFFQRGFRQHKQRGSAGHHDLNVHRRIAGLDGRRHQDHNVFCADAAGAVHLLQAAARRVPPASAGRLAVQGLDHHADGADGRGLRHVCALRAGAAARFWPPAV